jgi:polysaccharide export outer membrane protein
MKQLRKTAGYGGAIGGILLAGLLFAGCRTHKPVFSELPVMDQETAPGNRFHVGDLVTVVFSATSDQIPTHEERVKEDGTITLPYLGSIRAAGKTSGELQNEIHDLYVPKYYVNLTVTVRSEARYYYVGGQVKAPGPKEYLGETDIIKAIQAAGDFTDYAKKTKVRLTRGGHSEIINCNKAISDPRYHVPVYPGDKIFVPIRVFLE